MLVRRLMSVVVLTWLTGGASSVPAEDVRWMTDADRAWATAVEQKRPLLIFVTMPDCHYCTLMKNRTFRDPAVIKRLNDGFVVLAVDSTGSAELVRTLKVSSFPTTIVVSQQQRKIVGRVKGFVPPQKFAQRLVDIR